MKTGNKFKIEGIKLLSFALFENTTLEEIHLDDNKIKDEGLQYFIRKEKKLSPNLRTVSLASKKFN